MSSFIPFHRVSIGDEEIAEVTDTLRSGWLTTGVRARQFEQDFSARLGGAYAVALNSATAALHLALSALKAGVGDEVITTPMTFCATVQAILHAGATPVLADIRGDGNIDPASIEQRITEQTRAIIPVHMAGLPCEMNAIWEIARRHHLHVIEDAAHAAGACYEGHPIGAHPPALAGSDAVAFSFYATKNLTTGEGGMATTHSASLAETMRMMALHGTSRGAWERYSAHGDWHYDVLAHGFKYNLSDLQAALGIHQLRKLDGFIDRRRYYAGLYNQYFREIEEVEIPPDKIGCLHAWHLYVLRLRLDRLTIDRAEFIRQLQCRGIGTSVHFIPIPLHTYFQRMGLDRYACPVALALYPRIISLPLYPAMTEQELYRVAEAVRQIVESARRPVFSAHGGTVTC